MTAPVKQVCVNDQAVKRLRNGYPWIFANQIIQWRDRPDPGELVEVLDSNESCLGFAYANPDNVLALKRLYAPSAARSGPDRRPDEVLELGRKLDRARSKRLALTLDSDAYRLVWSEADSLPGLVCDVYGDLAVIQCLTQGMEQRKAIIIDWLISRLKPRGIFERSEGQGRRLEGLPPIRQWLWPEPIDGLSTVCKIHEGDDHFEVDLQKGHKTGFYLDQRAARRMLRGKQIQGNVLDAFCHSGGFALAAVRAGAEHVDAVDQDRDALEQLSVNARLNQAADRIQTCEADVFSFLRNAVKSGAQYDTVILDPPSFVRSRKEAEDAMRGYRELHVQTGKLLRNRGWLMTCTCSHHIGRQAFARMVQGTLHSAGKNLEHIRVFGPDQDHPEKPQIPESRYLTCLLARVRSA